MTSLSTDTVNAVRACAEYLGRRHPDTYQARRAAELASCLHEHWQLGLDLNQCAAVRNGHIEWSKHFLKRFIEAVNQSAIPLPPNRG